MSSEEMEYNMSRHPELYHMDTFGVIRLNETEYNKQTEVKQMSNEMTILIRAKYGRSGRYYCNDTIVDKESAIKTLEHKYPDVTITLTDEIEDIWVEDIEQAGVAFALDQLFNIYAEA
tara:strand:- start:223 stop:576 length:354 start_codon:yes stop_codon:yes gene_type:complete